MKNEDTKIQTADALYCIYLICEYEVSIILVNTPNMFTRFPKLDTISVSQKLTTYNEVIVNEP